VLTEYDEGTITWGRIFKYDSVGTLITSPIVAGTEITTYDLVVDSNDTLTYSIDNYTTDANQGGFVVRINNALTQYLWIQSIEPAPPSNVSDPRNLALDSRNNVYVTGPTQGSYPGFTQTGQIDIFVLKLASATGNRLWTRQFSGNSYDYGDGIAVSDAVYVSGHSESNPTLLQANQQLTFFFQIECLYNK
jgi:hypothetical protein